MSKEKSLKDINATQESSKYFPHTRLVSDFWQSKGLSLAKKLATHHLFLKDPF
jgi:hypothetical protein